MAQHDEHSCGVCELSVGIHRLAQRCEACDYDMCCAALMKHVEEPAKVPAEMPVEMPVEMPTDTAINGGHLRTGRRGAH